MGNIIRFDDAIADVPPPRRRELKVDQFLRRLDDHPDIVKIHDMLANATVYEVKRAATILSKLADEYVSEKAVAAWRERYSDLVR